MNWKKNVCSYLLWLIYAVAVSLGIAGRLLIVFGQAGQPKEYCFPVILALYLVVGLLVFALYKRNVKKRKAEPDAVIGNKRIIIEGMLFVGLLAGGIFLRAMHLQNLTEDYVIDMSFGNAFFEMAKITDGGVIPQVVHGATYIYLQLLHFIFLLFGNIFLAAVWLEVVLQCLTGVLLYFSVRKLSGRISAIIMLGFLMLSPYMIQKITLLSPEGMFGVIFALALGLLASTLTKSSCKPVIYLMVGVLIGVCCYFDLSGITILIFAASVFAVERENPTRWWNRRGVVFLWNVLGAVAGWCAVMALDAALCGKKVLCVMAAWFEVYQPHTFSFSPDVFYGIKNNPAVWCEFILLSIFLAAGIFSFWCRRKMERQGVWTATVIALLLMYCFDMLTPQMQGGTYLFFCFAVLAGIGVEEIFLEKNEPLEQVKGKADSKENTKTDGKEIASAEGKEQEKTKGIENAKAEGMESTNEPAIENTKVAGGISVDDETAPTGVRKKEIHFLENPLPLPKKHEAKVLDYRITDIQSNDFDYAVDDDDDFDI